MKKIREQLKEWFSLRENKLIFTGMSFAIIFAFTPIYGVSYLILLVIFARKIYFVRGFSSYFASFVVGFLVLCAAIMLGGMFAWLIHAKDFAIFNVLIFAGMTMTLNYFQLKSFENFAKISRKMFNPGDVVSLIISLILPLIFALSFLAQSPRQANIIRFLSFGWDNRAHMNLIQSDSEHQGYLYDTVPRENDPLDYRGFSS